MTINEILCRPVSAEVAESCEQVLLRVKSGDGLLSAFDAVFGAGAHMNPIIDDRDILHVCAIALAEMIRDMRRVPAYRAARSKLHAAWDEADAKASTFEERRAILAPAEAEFYANPAVALVEHLRTQVCEGESVSEDAAIGILAGAF